MESGDRDGPARRAPEERDTLDDLRRSALDGATPGGALAGRAWRWGLRLGGVVALLGLIAVAAVALSPLIPRPAPTKPAPLDITALQIPAEARSCLVDGAWSPDGAQIALVRDSQCVPNATKPGPTVMLFNGTTGALLNAFPLVSAVSQVSTPSGGGAAPSERVILDHVAWSPDGIQLAIPFVVIPQSAASAMTIGVALLTVRGPDVGALKLKTETVSSLSPPDSLAQAGQHSITEWDVQEGPRALSVTPSYAYQWGANGDLEPVTPPATPGAPKGPAGGVVISGGFSMWRHGLISTVNATLCDDGAEKFLPQPYVALDLSTLAWSPNGRYIAEVSASGRYDAPDAPANATPEPLTTSSACSPGPMPGQLPLAPMRDAGLRSELALVASRAGASADLEWRPDGQRLAAIGEEPVAGINAILIYDCRTGALLERYIAGQIPINGLPGTGPAKNFNDVFIGGSWSPNGRRLLIEATGTGAVPFILGPGALGA